jgi:hypothetical protein
MKKLQSLLKAILLRRTKLDIVHAIFTEDEQAYYTALETKTRLQFNKYVKAGNNRKELLERSRSCTIHHGSEPATNTYNSTHNSTTSGRIVLQTSQADSPEPVPPGPRRPSPSACAPVNAPGRPRLCSLT